MNPDRFKQTSRIVPDWPPDLQGYSLLLISRPTPTTETAHYCRQSDEYDIVSLLGPHIEMVQKRLDAGETLERIVGELERVIVHWGPFCTLPRDPLYVHVVYPTATAMMIDGKTGAARPASPEEIERMRAQYDPELQQSFRT